MSSPKNPRAEFESVSVLSVEEAVAYQEGKALRALVEEEGLGWVARCVEVALESGHPFLRGEARVALQLAPPREVVGALLPALTSESRRLRRRAMTLLPRLEAGELVRQMEPWLAEATREGKRAACVVLGALGEPGMGLLRELSDDADGAVARRAGRALAVAEERATLAVEMGLEAAVTSESAERPFGLRPPPGGVMPRRPGTFAVAAFNFSYGVNLGVLIRSAEAAGAAAVWVVGRDFYYRPSTKGSDWWIPVDVLPTPAACIERARAEGYGIVAVQQGAGAQSVYEAAWPERPLIVVGNEGDGLSAAFTEAADVQVHIPVTGEIDSLNVAVAASVAMYFFLAAAEQRPAAH